LAKDLKPLSVIDFKYTRKTYPSAKIFLDNS